MRVAGVTWGKGFDWETTLFDLTPVSYCQFGLLPQMHRAEVDIVANVRLLLEAAGRTVPSMDEPPPRWVCSFLRQQDTKRCGELSFPICGD